MLADGNTHPFDVYAATLEWEGSDLEIEVEAADIDPLVGMSLLNGQRLTIEVRDGGDVTIEALA